MQIVNVVGGALLLTLGRKIFWLFVAASGFFAGFELATQYLSIKSGWTAILIAVGIGLVGALLAYFFQKLVIGAAGFLAGAYIASRIAPQLGSQVKSWEWAIILVGGIIGIIAIYAIFEWALMFLSSVAGAMLIVEGLKLVGIAAIVIGIILFVVGMVFQTGLNRPRRSESKAASQ